MNNYERNCGRQMDCGCEENCNGCGRNNNGCGCGNNNGCGCGNNNGCGRPRYEITAESEVTEYICMKIHGTVRNGCGRPVENVRLFLLKCHCGKCKRIAETTTNQCGKFTFETCGKANDSKYRVVVARGSCNGSMEEEFGCGECGENFRGMNDFQPEMEEMEGFEDFGMNEMFNDDFDAYDRMNGNCGCQR